VCLVLGIKTWFGCWWLQFDGTPVDRRYRRRWTGSLPPRTWRSAATIGRWLS